MRERAPSNTLWDDVRELLEVWDEKNTRRLRADVQTRLDRLKKEGQSAWRRRVTGDANKRIRDHVRETVDQAGERCVYHYRYTPNSPDRERVSSALCPPFRAHAFLSSLPFPLFLGLTLSLSLSLSLSHTHTHTLSFLWSSSLL